MLTFDREVDAVVVGAGPSGAAAAFHLASAGRSVVLLDKHTFPRDKSCGDGVTRDAVCMLAEIGILPELSWSQKIRGARLFMRGQGSRDFGYPPGLSDPDFGLVVPRYQLDALLCRRAVAAGAELWEEASARQLLYEEGRVAGVEVVHGGAAKRLRARATIAADGVSSRLARQAGLVSDNPAEVGFAIRGYYSGVEGLTDLLEFYMPLLDSSSRHLLPSYGWVFPAGPGAVNIGVGVFRREHGANVRRLMERFVATLMAEDRRFCDMRPSGGWLGAPLRFDFAAERCMTGGLLLVGDAAGLISPFTGEGISYALSSARVAARVIHESITKNGEGPLDLADYARQLSATHAAYFDAGRHASRKYLLIWQVLEATFHSERPLFALCRRAALFPEGLGRPAGVEDLSPLLSLPTHRLTRDLEAITGLLTQAVRQDWPVLARVAQLGERDVAGLFRPALLLLIAFYAGSGREENAHLVGAAIELGHVAGLAHASVVEDAAAPQNNPTNWGNLIALGMADFLLSKAYQLASMAGPVFAAAITDAVGAMTTARMTELRFARRLDLNGPGQLDAVGRKTGPFFEVPCRLGALCGGLPADQQDALGRYGRDLGIAFQLVNEILELTGNEDPLGTTAADSLRDGTYSVPIRWAAAQASDAAADLRALLAAGILSSGEVQEVHRLVLQTDAVAQVTALAALARDRAQAAAQSVKDPAIQQVLCSLAESAFNRLSR